MIMKRILLTILALLTPAFAQEDHAARHRAAIAVGGPLTLADLGVTGATTLDGFASGNVYITNP